MQIVESRLFPLALDLFFCLALSSVWNTFSTADMIISLLVVCIIRISGRTTLISLLTLVVIVSSTAFKSLHLNYNFGVLEQDYRRSALVSSWERETIRRLVTRRFNRVRKNLDISYARNNDRGRRAREREALAGASFFLSLVDDASNFTGIHRTWSKWSLRGQNRTRVRAQKI